MSFTANDVLMLCRAGYNAQQIALLSKAAEQAAQQPAQQPVQQPAQQPVQQPAQQPAQQPVQQQAQPAQQPAQPAQQPAQPTPGDIMQQLQQLTGAIQMQNQLNSQQPQPETVDDILATVVEP